MKKSRGVFVTALILCLVVPTILLGIVAVGISAGISIAEEDKRREMERLELELDL